MPISRVSASSYSSPDFALYSIENLDRPLDEAVALENHPVHDRYEHLGVGIMRFFEERSKGSHPLVFQNILMEIDRLLNPAFDQLLEVNFDQVVIQCCRTGDWRFFFMIIIHILVELEPEIASRHPNRFDRILKIAAERPQSQKENIYELCLYVSLDYNQFDRALQVANLLTTKKEEALSKIITTLCNQGELGHAAEIVEQIKTHDIKMFLLREIAMAALKNNTVGDRALAIADLFNDHFWKDRYFGQLAIQLCHKNQAKRAVEIRQMIESAEVQLKVATIMKDCYLSSAVIHYCKHGDVQNASEVFELITNQDVRSATKTMIIDIFRETFKILP